LNQHIGTITHSYGLGFHVKCNNQIYLAVTKAKKTEYVVGDLVYLEIINQQQAIISQLLPRKNLLKRQDKQRYKLIASNLDQMLIVIAATPNHNEFLLNKLLIAANHLDITPIIVINKNDLAISQDFIANAIALYQQQLNYQTIHLSAVTTCRDLLPLLNNKTSILVGQSGVGLSLIHI
jgi:ribosome biogenesis GTPase